MHPRISIGDPSLQAIGQKAVEDGAVAGATGAFANPANTIGWDLFLVDTDFVSLEEARRGLEITRSQMNRVLDHILNNM